MRKFLAVVAGMLVGGALLVAPSTAAQGRPAKTDWSRVVDFTKTGLDRYNPADAALLKMLSPERIIDPADRARFQRQLDSLVAAQSRARAYGATKQEIGRIAATEAVDTIDPGCQLTSSYPGGYDLCGYDSAGDWMSFWGSGRKHRMWAAVQETDQSPPGNNSWRVWYKSQAYGLSSDNVDHWVDTKQVEAWTWQGPYKYNVGAANPLITSPACSPCYWTGGWHAFRIPSTEPEYVEGHGSYLVRDYVEIKDTNDSSTTDNILGSMWWDRDGGWSYYPGPRGYEP
jgi:hypothetical protein